MTATRVLWILWCAAWAATWVVVGLFTFGLGWLGTIASVLAVFIPVGAQRVVVVYPPPYRR